MKSIPEAQALAKKRYRLTLNLIVGLSIMVFVSIVGLGFVLLQQIYSLQENVELTDHIVNANIRTLGQLQRELLRLKVVLIRDEADSEDIEFYRSLTAQRMNEVTLSYHAQALANDSLLETSEMLAARWEDELQPIIRTIIDGSAEDTEQSISAATEIIDEIELAFNTVSSQAENNRKIQAGRANDAAILFVEDTRSLLYGLGATILGYVLFMGFVVSAYIRFDRQRELTNKQLLLQQTRLSSLIQIASQSTNMDEQLQQVVQQGAALLDMPIGIISRIYGEGYTVAHAHSPDQIIQVGMTCDLDATMCKQTVENKSVLAVDSLVNGSSIPKPCFDVIIPGSYIGVPIMVDGSIYGTLSFVGDSPRENSFVDSDLDFVRLMGHWVGFTLERAESQNELAAYAKNLEQSNVELQQFAYAASHDLQEPLRKIQTFGSRLESKYGDKLEERGMEYLKRMKTAANRMQILIQDLLSLSRVTTQAQPFEDTDLNEVISGVLSDLEINIEKSKSDIQIQNLPTIKADATQMRQLFQNLISNAIKFGRSDVTPIIQIGCNKNTMQSITTWEFWITDNGIGFDQQYAEKIFSVFQRLHGRDEYEGTGVGLALCRKIVDRHGGTIQASSQPNQGATFRINLPFKDN